MASSIEELVIEKVKALAPQHQMEVLEFVETLEQRASSVNGESVAREGNGIWEEIEQLSKQVPSEEWAKLPTDLSENIDHYLYGAPKKK